MPWQTEVREELFPRTISLSGSALEWPSEVAALCLTVYLGLSNRLRLRKLDWCRR